MLFAVSAFPDLTFSLLEFIENGDLRLGYARTLGKPSNGNTNAVIETVM